MVRITVDANLPGRLASLREPAELYAPDGRRIGRFLPDAAVSSPVSQTRERDRCPYTPEELAAMKAEPGGQPLIDIWKELGRE